jgi:hypothetical protein
MLRRDFCKVSGMCFLAYPILRLDWLDPSPPEPGETGLWIHGSPYLGHSDYRKDFRGLSQDEIKLEIVHFRTAEPWRRMALFEL